jgi:Ribonuclease G/E
MSGREAFLDEGFGERRGVVLLDGRPERMIIERDGDSPAQRLGARSVARVRAVEKAQGMAYLVLPHGPDAVAPAGRLAQGQILSVEIAAEARGEKGPGVVILGPATGEPRLIEEAPALEARLAGWTGAAPRRGEAARTAADAAEAAALASLHDLPGGGRIAIEPTRALVAVDVDLAGRRGADARRLARAVNLAAIAEAARLIRLKGLGGLVVFDLVGKGHDGTALSQAAVQAFEPDQPGVSIGPISRFGLFELATPHRFAPLAERLLDVDGRLSLQTIARRVARAIQNEARANPGVRLEVRASPDVAAAFETHMKELTGIFGQRLECIADPSLPRASYEIAAR